MKNSKLIGLLKSFSNSEWRAFDDFLASPFFNKKKINLKLYRLLKKQASRDFPEAAIARPYLFKQLFPRARYDERQLNHVISEVFKLAEQFISYREFQSERALPQLFTARAHLKRKQDKSYQHQARKTAKILEDAPLRDHTYHYQSTLLADLAEQHYTLKEVHRQNDNLPKAARHFDQYYLSRKLQYLCIMLDRQKFLPMEYEMPLLPFIREIIESQQFDSPSIEIYYHLLKTLSNEAPEADFNYFKQLLSQNLKAFTGEEARQLYLLAINFCVHQIRLGHRSYAAELMHFYMEGIEREILLEEGKLSPWMYKNIVKLGLGLNRLEWVEQFVRQYSQYLSDALRDDAYHFSLADLYFHKKEYDKTLTQLNKVEFTDIHYNLDAKATLLKTYYMQGEIEPMLSLVSSFKLFLRRQKSLSRHVRDSYFNFARLLKKIYQKGHSQNATIRQEIAATKALNGRSWLLQQLD